MRDIVPRQHHNIRLKKIYPLDTVLKILSADRSAAMQVTDMDYPFASKLRRQVLKFKPDFYNLNPLRPDPANIHCPGSAKSKTAESSPFKIPPFASYHPLSLLLPNPVY